MGKSFKSNNNYDAKKIKKIKKENKSVRRKFNDKFNVKHIITNDFTDEEYND